MSSINLAFSTCNNAMQFSWCVQTSRCSMFSARAPWLSVLCLELCNRRPSFCTYAQKHISLQLGNVALAAWENYSDSGCATVRNDMNVDLLSWICFRSVTELGLRESWSGKSWELMSSDFQQDKDSQHIAKITQESVSYSPDQPIKHVWRHENMVGGCLKLLKVCIWLRLMMKLYFSVCEINLSKMMLLICSPDVSHTESFGLEISPTEVRSSPLSHTHTHAQAPLKPFPC